MMKKVLVLMLVLGMASVAGAEIIPGLLKISVNGVLEPPVINLQPSGTATLDIWTPNGMPSMTAMDMVLIVGTGCGTISGGVGLNPYGSASLVMYTAKDLVANVPAGQDGGVFVASTLELAIPGMTKIFDEITFHCESANGPTVITLAGINEDWDYTSEPPAVIYDQVTINQIPEPATIALLGLGGLFLRRRKK